jgi:hypothetical protein
MRKLFLFSVFFILLISCQKPDCEEQYRKNNESYLNALNYARTYEQVQEITRQYNSKNQEISQNCN